MCIRDRDGCIDKRLSLAAGVYTLQDVLDLVHKDFPELNGKVPAGNPGVRGVTADELFSFNNDETKKVLGFKFIDFQKSAHDSIAQILDAERRS